MIEETPRGTCPLCHKGILAYEDDKPGLTVQHFSCGHKRFATRLAENNSSRFALRFKGKRAGKGKPFVLGKSGDDLYKRLRKWMRREMTVDREKDSYKEKVTDPETGKVVHSCEEPLSKHIGHGSAKAKAKE